jgi:hypothetical protein
MSKVEAYQERNTARLDRAAVIRAMQHLQEIKKTIRNLNRINKNRTDLIQSGTIKTLKSERNYLISGFTAYQEAAWRLLAGQKAREKERGIFAIYDTSSKTYVPLDLPPDPLPQLKVDDTNGFNFVTVSEDTVFDGIIVKAGEKLWIKPHKGDKGDCGDPESVSLKPGDKVLVTNLPGAEDYVRIVGDPILPKSKTNKLTTEQRRTNGARGAAIRDENKRKKLALDAGEFHAYTKRGDKVKRIGSHYKSMRGAFNFLRLSYQKDMASDYFVYDNKGQCWVYDSEVHNLRRNSDSSAI